MSAEDDLNEKTAEEPVDPALNQELVDAALNQSPYFNISPSTFKPAESGVDDNKDYSE